MPLDSGLRGAVSSGKPHLDPGLFPGLTSDSVSSEFYLFAVPVSAPGTGQR